jgi:hypothetical protein
MKKLAERGKSWKIDDWNTGDQLARTLAHTIRQSIEAADPLASVFYDVRNDSQH